MDQALSATTTTTTISSAAAPVCPLCKRNVHSYDDGMVFTQCPHVYHCSCVFEQYKDFGITKCVACYPGIMAQNTLGHRPVHMNDDALVQRLNVPASKSCIDLHAEQIANWRDPIVATDFTVRSPMAKPFMSLSARISGISEEAQKKSSVIAIIADAKLDLAQHGITLADIINLGTVDLHGWLQYRPLHDLCDLGATADHLLMNFKLGRCAWDHSADYSCIKNHMRITWDQFLTMAFRGDLRMAMKTRIPAQVYVLLGMNMKKLCRLTEGRMIFLENLNHIPLRVLVECMDFDADTFRSLSMSEDSRISMHWDDESITQLFDLTRVN